MRRGQDIAMAAAKVGAPAGSVDDAVRRTYESWGYGPRYKLPGTSHRTGHGIGMEGHEPVNLVHGETTPLAPGMCFSNEPGIYLPGKFGIRLEDCFHMTAAGPEMVQPCRRRRSTSRFDAAPLDICAPPPRCQPALTRGTAWKSERSGASASSGRCWSASSSAWSSA